MDGGKKWLVPAQKISKGARNGYLCCWSSAVVLGDYLYEKVVLFCCNSYLHSCHHFTISQPEKLFYDGKNAGMVKTVDWQLGR